MRQEGKFELRKKGSSFVLYSFCHLEFAVFVRCINSFSFFDLFKESSANWEDIGGLKQARALLKETFEFPTQYKKLFDTAPIRMRSGLLLYGPPGKIFFYEIDKTKQKQKD